VSEDVAAATDFGGNYLSPGDDTRRTELCQAAIGYAKRGFAVIPVRWMEDGECSCQRGAECPSPGKHPVHDAWPDVATASPIDVAHWWRPPPAGLASEWWPKANIGIVTGRKSRIFVLDVDSYNGGDQTLGAYERRHHALPETRIHHTGSGGVHYIWAHPGFDVRNNAGKTLGQGLDLRGERGFIVAPPSVSAKGAYELNPAQDTDPATAPEWLLNLLRSYDREQTGASIAGAMPDVPGAGGRRYAEAALRSETGRMREAESGYRNDTLNQCAFSLGTLGGAGLLDEATAFGALREAALEAGLDEGEIRATFLSGWKSGLENPRQVQWQAMGSEWPARARTEFGLADRMVDHWGSMLKWVPEWASWAVYQSGVWRKDSPQAGEWFAQMMIRALADTEALSYEEEPGEAPDETPTPSPREQFLEWVAKQQTRKAVSSAARLSIGLPLMRMDQGTFDLDPVLLNVKNGVVNLATGEFTDHSPDLRMTLQADVHYRPAETAPRWDDFLRRVQPDPDMRAYLQRVAGYCATGLVSEQAMFLWHGAGANGKSVAQAVLAHILGAYAQTMPVSTLMASTVDDRIPNDVARMAGKRFLIATETKQGRKLDEQRLKQLTGGDTIAARYMRAEYFEFKPVGKLQLTTNHLPSMSDDAATWRRIHLITWPVVIPEHERDGFLQQRLISEESSGILNWVIEGALAWQQVGLSKPDAVKQAIEDYRVEEDTVEQFIAACVDIVPPQRNVAGRDGGAIHAAYEYWCRQEHVPPMGRKALTARLKKHGYEFYRSGNWAGFPGLQVRSMPLMG
jgi:putative DNA primase/helicase